MTHCAPAWRARVRIICAAVVLAASMPVVAQVGGQQAVAAATPRGYVVPTILPPGIDPGALGVAQDISGRAAPLEPTEQKTVCAQPRLNGPPPREAPVAQRVLDLESAWQFSRGAGQKVAVIDTGVNRHPRLPALQVGGDYVADTDGTVDCDGHGTLVAGIIAARPSPDDAFVGVAPEAEILTIRQLSLAYQAKNHRGDSPPGTIDGSGYGNVLTLAGAVVRAVDFGATVINISEVACAAAGADTADGALGAAVRYAYERNVVVVAAAGNVQSDGACSEQNDGTGWAKVKTIASPAWFTPYVLTVASVDPNGSPSELSLNGPWIGAAAIGRQIVSLDSKPGGAGLVDAVETSEGPSAIEGTSFAAPYVAGLAALVRARFPQLTAQQVIDRIVRTAHQPGAGRDDKIGAGLIDPTAALTAQLPDLPVGANAQSPHAYVPPPPPAAVSPWPRRIAIFGSLTCLSGLIIGYAVAVPYRRRRTNEQLPELDS